MIKFKALFSFKQNEVKRAFSYAKLHSQIKGLKLLESEIPDQPGQLGLEHGKLLIVIPRRVGKASKRNKIRRQIRAIFYEEKLYESKKIFILLVYKQALELSLDEIKKFLHEK